jgi:hypothetical protein
MNIFLSSSIGLYLIAGSQIEIKKFFHVANVVVNLQCLGIDNLDHIIIVAKNWPNDDCVGCALNPKSTSYFLTLKLLQFNKTTTHGNQRAF